MSAAIEKENSDAMDASNVAAQPAAQPPKVSLKDLPQLGTSYAVNTTVNWGPKVRPVVENASANGNSSHFSALSNSKRMRSNVLQEAFTLDLQSQLSINKPEFSKIVLAVEKAHRVSVESTLSRSSRTFLISGAKADVESAKRELVRKITKPVAQVLQVPLSCRSRIIGPAGKTIRELSAEFGVQIDVEKQTLPAADDQDETLIDVTVHGDVSSVGLAKKKIGSIVEEETRNLTAKLTLEDESLLSYVEFAQFEKDDDVKVQFYRKSGDIVISGVREKVKSVKDEIKAYLDTLSSDLKNETVKIPGKFQVLIDADEILQKFQVEVQFPVENGSDQVVFSGRTQKVADAIAYARASSKNFAVDSLDISKSHSKNLEHAKILSMYFEKYDFLKQLSVEYPTVKIHLPKSRFLQNADNVTVTIVGDLDNSDQIKIVRKELIGLVNKITPLDILSIDDLNHKLFHKDIATILSSSDVRFIQMGDHFNNVDTIVLFDNSDEEDFKPSADEVLEKLQNFNALLDPLRERQKNLDTLVFNLEGDAQTSLLSEGKKTLALLLEDVSREDGNLIISLNTPSRNELTLKGNERAIKKAKKALQSIADSPSKKTTITFEIPANTVSRTVGAKGANLNTIREKFDCTIQIPTVDELSTKDKMAEVTLTGLQYNLDHAKAYIVAESKKWADIITKEIVIPSKFHRNMAGPQGTYRHRLQDKYNVRINFPKAGDIVTIRGPSRGVNKAEQELQALLDFETENGHKSIINVSVDQVPRIIGKGGENIKDICADFGVDLNFLQNANDQSAITAGSVELEITGSRQAIKDATTKIQSIVTEAANFTTENLNVERKYHRFIVGPGGHTLREIIAKAGGDEIRNKHIQIPNSDSQEETIVIQGPKKFVSSAVKQITEIVENMKNRITKELDIPNDRQGALIGPGGSVRTQLEKEFNISLDVPNKGETGTVKINGLPKDIENAEKKIINEIIKDNFDTELQVPASTHEFVSERGAFIQQLRMNNFVSVKHGDTTRRATKLSRTPINIPIETVAGGENEKVKVTIQESSSKSSEEGSISWKLSYEPIDTSLFVLEGEEKPDKEASANLRSEESKQKALAVATDLINQKVEWAKNAHFAGYVWAQDPTNFRKVVGPGGSNVQKIRDASKTLINVPRKSDKINNVIYVRGTKEGVEKATEAILKALK